MRMYQTRLVKHALGLNKPVALLNLGPTRADGLAGIEKLDIATGAVMRSVAKIVASVGPSECVFGH
jgi:NAD-dependent deacetylase sirtuin 4